MDWERVGSTVRELFRKNGRDLDVHRGATPLTDLISKDQSPDLDEMTEIQLCEFAAESNIAIGEGLDRFEMIDGIKDALEKNWEERLKGMRATLDYIAKDGPHPLAIVRNFCGIAKAVRPKCILNASLAKLAVICDDGKGRSSDGRATVSARVERLFNDPIKKAGMRGYKASFQKTETACANYSSSATGNQNRLGKDFLKVAKNGNDNGHKP